MNILISGPESFISAIIELKSYLRFNILLNQKNISSSTNNNLDGMICHQETSDIDHLKNIAKSQNCLMIFATKKVIKNLRDFDYVLKLPTTINEINNIVEVSLAKREFTKNSSIKIKSYLLDKNEKKLIKENNSIILTEKEIQLLEILLNKKGPVSKDDILSLVWQYSSETDTHTVETHIYRLRKKISEKFFDETFILNNKEGYYLWKKEINLRLIYLLKNIVKESSNLRKVKEVLKEEKNNLF